MKKIWYSFLLLLLTLSAFNLLDINTEHIAIVLVLIHSIIVILILLMHEKYKQKIILIGAFLFRLFFLFWDIYARNIFVLPNAGTDDVGFYKSAVMISNNLSLLSGRIYGSHYAKTTGLLFYFTGPSRIFGGYINVVLGISVVIITLQILRLLKIPEDIELLILAIISFFPNSLFMSAMFRREMIGTFLNTLSVYYFVEWLISNKRSKALISMTLILMSTVFHSGVIGVIVGYIFAFIFYDFSSNKIKVKINAIPLTVVILLLLGTAFYFFREPLLNNLGEFDEATDIIKASNRGGGGARYLGDMNITNFKELILYTPIKMFYFLFSPVPWEWRMLADLLTFILDSILYLLILLYYLLNNKKFVVDQELILFLLISILTTTVIFGIGVGNAGTAMRHRQKILPLFAVLLALMMKSKREKKEIV